MKPRPHAKLIKLWADGHEVERLWANGSWLIDNDPMWEEWEEYRIKPEPKPDVWCAYLVSNYDPDPEVDAPKVEHNGSMLESNLKLTFDGETGELKSAEVTK